MGELVVKRVTKSNIGDFYKDYLGSFPGLSNKEILVLASLFDLKYSGIQFGASERNSVANGIGITYSNMSTVIHNLKRKGAIKGFIEGLVVSPLYIPKQSVILTNIIKINE